MAAGGGAPRLLGALLAGGLALAACAAPPPAADPPPPRIPVERAYRPPAGPPPPPPTLVAPLAPAAAIDALAGALARLDPELRRGSAADGTAWLVLTSRGDPEPFLDCGSFEAVAPDGRVERLPAARLAVRLAVPAAAGREVLLRQLRLDGRLAVAARPEGRGSRLEVVASYVLTRTVDRVALDGRVLDSQRQTVAFESGAAGRFDQGLECRPTGRLEAAVIEAAERLTGAAGAAPGDGRAGG